MAQHWPKCLNPSPKLPHLRHSNLKVTEIIKKIYYREDYAKIQYGPWWAV
jgi:hypothetical protein